MKRGFRIMLVANLQKRPLIYEIVQFKYMNGCHVRGGQDLFSDLSYRKADSN